MKKKTINYFIGVCSVVFFMVGCSNVILEKDSSPSVSYQRDEDVLSLLEKTEINLPDDVSIEKIGIDKEFYIDSFTERAALKFNRSVSSKNIVIDEDELISIIDEAVSNYEIPELVSPTDVDIEKISELLPGLSEEEIVNNLETIGKIYQDIVVANVDDEILEKIKDDSLARYSTYEISGTTITLHEIAACLKHPFSALTLKTQKELAETNTDKYMGTGSGLNNKKDAFRHAVLNVTMAKEGWGLKSAKLAWAYDMATAHEQGARYVEKESEMDLHNNEVGRRVYDLNTPITYGQFLWWTVENGVSEKSYDFYCNIIKQKINTSKFIDKTLSYNVVKSNIQKENNDTLVYIVR